MTESVSFIVVLVVWIAGIVGFPVLFTRFYTGWAGIALHSRFPGRLPETRPADVKAWTQQIARDTHALAEASRFLCILGGIACFVGNKYLFYVHYGLTGVFVLAVATLLMSTSGQFESKEQ